MLTQLAKAIKSIHNNKKDTNSNPIDKMSQEDKEKYFKRIFQQETSW